jgi:sugar transferase (PEP-CTERM/EpsH1 system associated)
MHLLYRLHPGGMEYGVIKLTNGLVGSRVVSSICSTVPATQIKELLDPSVRLIECRRREGNDPSLVWQLYRLLKRERPDIVHTHAWGTLIEGLVAARLARVPIVVHGEHGTLQTSRGQVWAQRWGWNAADRVLSVSSKLADRMAGEIGFLRERITTIRNGVDFTRFDRRNRQAGRAALALGPNDLAVGTVGRLVDVKDHANLIEALRILHGAGVRFKGFIAGDGPLRESLQQQIDTLGLATCVTLLGHRADVHAVLPALDVFVLSSKSEGLSNTIQEAMASAVPVVATRVGGADELVDDGLTGVLVPPRDPHALAVALEGVARNAGRRAAMANASELKAQREFSLERMLREYEQLYLNLASKGDAHHLAGARASQSTL